MKYKLGDLTVKHWNDWDSVPRDPVSIGAFILGSTVGTTAILGITGLTAQFIVGYLVTTAITSWAMAALAPKPDFSSFASQGTLVNSRDAAAAAQFVYGEVRKGGVVTFYESTGTKNKFLHQVIVVAGHEVEAIDDIYINDQIATWDASTGLVSTAGAGADQTNWSGKIRIRKYLGNQTAADSELVAETSVTASFVGSEIAYLYVKYEYDQDVFANGVPLITVKVRGKKVYDPRTTATAYSNNAALCIRDYIASVYGLNDSAIDEVFMAAAANEADEAVALDGGGTEPRYTMNGIVSASRSTGSALGDMVTSCAGTLFWGSGYWKLKVGVYTAPVKTLTLDDLRGPINLETRISMRDNFNAVRGTFNDASQGYITADYPETISAAFRTEDGGEEVALDMPLAFTTSAATAQRLAKLTLFRGREQMTMNADFGLEAFSVEVGDIIEFENERYWTGGKEFEVVGWRFEANQEAGDLRVNLTLRETSQAAFDWNAEETAIISNNTTLPNAYANMDISNVSAASFGGLNSDGTFFPSIALSWTAASNAFVTHYEVQWRPNTQTEYASLTTSRNGVEIGPALDGVVYDLRARAVSALGNKGAFSSITFTASSDQTAPPAPTLLAATAGPRSVSLAWTNPVAPDLQKINIYQKSSATPAPVVGTDVPIASTVGQYYVVENLLPLAPKFYWVTAVDYTGNESVISSSVTATPTLLDGNQIEDLSIETVKMTNDAITSIVTFNSSLPFVGAFTSSQPPTSGNSYGDFFEILAYIDDAAIRPNIFGVARYKVQGSANGFSEVRLVTSIAFVGSGGSAVTLAQTSTYHSGSAVFGEFMHNVTYDSVLNVNGSCQIWTQAYVKNVTSPSISAQGYGLARRK